MNDFDDVSIFFLGVALALALLFLFMATKSQPPLPPLSLPSMEGEFAATSANDLLLHLSKRATFFGASWCGFTQKQFQVLGVTQTDLKGIDYVECEENNPRCEQDKIEAFPTWKIDGQLYSGFQDVDQLKALLQI